MARGKKSKSWAMALGGLVMCALSTPAWAGEIVVHAVPVRDFMQGFASRVGVKFRACGNASVTGRFFIEVAADLEHAVREAGRTLTFAKDGTWLVDCDSGDKLQADPLANYVSTPIANAATGSAFPKYSRGLDPNSVEFREAALASYRAGPQPVNVGALPSAPPDAYRHLRTRYVPKGKLEFLEALGLKVLGNPDIPGPLLLVGPAKIVDQAEEYIRAVDSCPRQLRVEATVVTRANSRARKRSFGVRFNSKKVEIGGNAFRAELPLLSPFLNANRDIFEAGTNATFRGRVVEGSELKLSDGQDVPIRSATSVTDRETRQDVIYRTAGHQLNIRVMSLNEGEAYLLVDHSISALAGSSELGPAFATRSTSSAFRIGYLSPVILSLSGADTASRQRSRGILSRGDVLESNDAGAFLVLAVQREGCGVAVGEDVQPKAAPHPSASGGR